MGNQLVSKAVVIPSNTGVSGHQIPLQVALMAPDGSALAGVKKQAAQADTTAADLAALKVDFNLLLAKLRSAGILS